MLLTASDGYSLYRPSKCVRRVYLRHQGIKEGEPSPFAEVIREQGKRHELNHLQSFPQVVDLSSGTRMDRYVRTREAVGNQSPVLYQGALSATIMLNDVSCEVVGDPDFLICDSGRYVIRDAKLARTITEKDHPEIFWQVRIYGWLFQKMFGELPARLEVYAGAGDIAEVPMSGETSVLEQLSEMLALKQAPSEPYSPIGWSKCGDCGFKGYCWPRAEERRDVALVSGVDQGLAVALREDGIETMDDFLSRFDAASLSEYKRPVGSKLQRVGKQAPAILRLARSLVEGKEILIEPPAILDHARYVMFDLEGIPPQMDELGKIYLWGLQVFPEGQGEYQAATAGFGTEGDRQGWKEFLAMAGRIFEQYGDLPFVHWHHYERVHVTKYAERFGDPQGIAARVRQNLLDLLPITKNSVALPLPSYSLKVVEKYIGFERSQDEYGGDWSMAKYIEATEENDKQKQAEIIDQIKTYNREDLAATWAVLDWLKNLNVGDTNPIMPSPSND